MSSTTNPTKTKNTEARQTTPEYATIYFDTTDPANVGWAYNVIVDGDHTSGPLDMSDVEDEDITRETLVAALISELPLLAIEELDFRRSGAGRGYEARPYASRS